METNRAPARTDHFGDDSMSRCWLPESAIHEMERSSLIGQLYVQWDGLRNAGGATFTPIFDWEALLPRYQSPLLTFYDLETGTEPFFYAHDHSGFMSALKPDFYRRCLLADLREIAEEKSAWYQWVVQTISGKQDFYRRLILPLMDRNGRCNHILMVRTWSLTERRNTVDSVIHAGHPLEN